jgi:signal peptidase II
VGGQQYDWYVFNLADVGIVAGVVGLLYESTFARGLSQAVEKTPEKAPQKRPDP